MGKSWESSTPDKYSGNSNKYTTDLKKETMKNRKSCFEWASTTNEVINHKWRRNCQELTGRLMLGEQHLSVGNPRNSQSWSFNTGFNKTPREPESGRAKASSEATQKAFSCGSLPAARRAAPAGRGAERRARPGAEEAAASRAAAANGRRARPEARRAGPAGPP